MIKGIDHIDISVEDVEESIKVFQKMGFELLHRTTHTGSAAELKLPGANQPIFEVHPVMAQYLEGKTGIRHIAFLVDNAQKTLDELKAEGVRFPQDRVLFQPQTGRTMIVTEDLGRFFLHFVEEGRKPFITH